MSQQRKDTSGWKRTRRNILAFGGILAAASLSQLGTKNADARTAGCFLRGTRILTPYGERNIEDLQIGDLVVTANGQEKPIQWIGRRVYNRTTERDWVQAIKPIRIARGALGPDIPRRDLFVSEYHCLLIDDVLMRAVDLLNGSSITRHSAVELCEIEYLHIKLAMHDVIFAEGAPSESLRLQLDEASIERFDNFVEYERLYGSRVTFPEMPCAPIGFGGGRERLRSRVRSAVSPWFDRRNAFDKARDRLEERAQGFL